MLLQGASDASVSEVLATVLLTGMTLVLMGGFGLTVLATVSEEGATPSASVSFSAEIGASNLTATLIAGSTLDLSATRLVVIVNETDATGAYPTSGRWAPGESIVVQLTSPLPPDARVTLLVVDSDANAAVGRATRTLLTQSTRPDYLGNSLTATAEVEPVPVTADGRTLANLTVAVTSTFGRDLVTGAKVDLTPVGGLGEVALRDDGHGPDLVAGDGVWSAQFTVSGYGFLTSTERERIPLTVTARDVLGGTTQTTASVWLKPAPLSKVVAGAIFQNVPGSGSIAYLNFTNFTFRNAGLLENDVIELRVSDLQDTTRSWTALVRLTDEDARCPGEPVVESVTLLRDDLPSGNATLTPTTCFVVGSGASLNLVTPSESRDGATPPNAITWSGDAASYAYRASGIGEPNEAIVTFMGDSRSFGTSMMGIGQANLTWGRLAPGVDATTPRAPTLGSPASGNGTVSLSWSAPSDTGGTSLTGYTVYHGTTSPPTTNFTFTSGTTATVTGLTNGQQYHFAVSASNAKGEGSKSGSVSATPLALPDPPQNLAATAGDAQVSLSWSAPSDHGGSTVTSYKVYYGTTSPPTTLWTTTTSPGATVTGLTNDQPHHFAVSAVNAVGEGSRSGSVSATPASSGTPPGAPQNLTASPANNQVGLSWSAPTSGGSSAVASYKVYRGTASGSHALLATIGANATFTDRTAVNGITYHYAVSAVNAAGEGVKSAEVGATPDAAVSFDCSNVTTTSGSIGTGGCGALQFADLNYAVLDESGSGSAKTINMTFTYNLTGVTGTATLQMNGYMGKNNEALHLQARAANGTFVTITTLPISVGTTPTTVSGALDAATYWPSGRLTIRLIDDGTDPASSSWNVDYVRMVTT